MALNPISDLLQGIKRLYVGLQGVKSDGVTMEKIKTNDAGAMKVSAELTGSIFVEQLSNTDAVANVITFSAPITAVEIIHEETNWQTFIVNGITFTIPPGVYSRQIGGTPSAEVTIPTGITCVVGRLV